MRGQGTQKFLKNPQQQAYIFFLRQHNTLPTGTYSVWRSKWHCKTPKVLITCLLDLPGVAWVALKAFCLYMVFRHQTACRQRQDWEIWGDFCAAQAYVMLFY